MASPPEHDPLDNARLSVDLDALAANYRTLGALAGGAEVAPVVKAQGYGVGAIPAALRLWPEGARSFFVARASSGEDLRGALGRERPARIFILDGCTPGAEARLLAADLTPVLASVEDLTRWRAAARNVGRRLGAALHVDTGLNRLGFSMEELRALAAAPSDLDGVDVELVLSHLVNGADAGDPMNARQLARFREMTALFPGAKASLAASGGILLGQEYAFDMVRPGMSLYGVAAAEAADARLKTVATLEARILQTRRVPAGDTVGYGGAWTATRPTKVAIIGLGYGDGVLRANFPGGAAWFDGALRPFVGRLSMDLAAIDVTGSDAPQTGAWVELFGSNLPIEDVARSAGTIGYEILSSVGARLKPIYREG